MPVQRRASSMLRIIGCAVPARKNAVDASRSASKWLEKHNPRLEPGVSMQHRNVGKHTRYLP